MRSKAHVKTHPIHPMLIALPLGQWIGAWAFDVLGRTRRNSRLTDAGYYCTVTGCLGALAAAVPGAMDWYSVIPPESSAKQRGLLHGSLNVAALSLFGTVALRRKGSRHRPDGLDLALSTAGLALIGWSGWLGGTLSYRNQIGVTHLGGNASPQLVRDVPDASQPVCREDELRPGQLVLARIGGRRIALGKTDQGVLAIDDHCTHRGGPLSDGALIGCTVQCPWHGSQFDMRTGAVVAGPAGEKVDTHKVEVRNGSVFVHIHQPADAPKAA